MLNSNVAKAKKNSTVKTLSLNNSNTKLSLKTSKNIQKCAKECKNGQKGVKNKNMQRMLKYKKEIAQQYYLSQIAFETFCFSAKFRQKPNRYCK